MFNLRRSGFSEKPLVAESDLFCRGDLRAAAAANRICGMERRAKRLPAAWSAPCETLDEYARRHGGSRYSTLIRQHVETACMRIASGETLNSVCRDKNMPSLRWYSMLQIACAEARSMIAAARVQGAHAMADESVDVTLRATPKTAALAAVQSKALQWAAGKRDRASYGDSVRHEVQGGIDLRVAMANAEQRRRERLICDQTRVIESQVVDSKRLSADADGDGKSPAVDSERSESADPVR